MEYSPVLIGARIKKERTRMNWSQDDLLKKLFRKESYRTAMNWENGKVLPPLADMFKMCDLFDCELGYLLGEFPEHTRAATDICDITGLTAEAVERLGSWKKISKATRTYSSAEVALRFINDLICFSLAGELAEEAGSFQQCLSEIYESLQSFMDPKRISAEIDRGRDGLMEDNIDRVLFYEYKAKDLFGEFMEALAGHSKLELRDLEKKYKGLFCDEQSI